MADSSYDLWLCESRFGRPATNLIKITPLKTKRSHNDETLNHPSHRTYLHQPLYGGMRLPSANCYGGVVGGPRDRHAHRLYGRRPR